MIALAILRVQDLHEGASWAVSLENIRGMKNAMILTPAFVFILYGVILYSIVGTAVLVFASERPGPSWP